MIRVIDKPTEFTALIPGDRDGRCEADAIRIAGDLSPGKCVVKGAGNVVTWDKRKGYGFSGATLIFTGDDLAEFEIEFTMWTQTQLAEWKDFAKKYFTKAPAAPQFAGSFLPAVPRPKALGVYHPILAELGITTIVYRKIHQFDQPSIGRWVKRVEFIQYRAPKPFLGAPKQPIPDTKKQGPTADDAQQLENRAKMQRVQALMKGLATGHG